jgi:hypothetical protein
LFQPGDYQFAIALVSRGEVDLKPLVTHRYILSCKRSALLTKGLVFHLPKLKMHLKRLKPERALTERARSK